jgi:hypothetical protein
LNTFPRSIRSVIRPVKGVSFFFDFSFCYRVIAFCHAHKVVDAYFLAVASSWLAERQFQEVPSGTDTVDANQNCCLPSAHPVPIPL